MRYNELQSCLSYVCDDFLSGLDEAMIGLSNGPKESESHHENPEIKIGGTVANELKAFGKECKKI